MGRPAGPGPPYRLHVRKAGPARRAAVLARHAGRHPGHDRRPRAPTRARVQRTGHGRQGALRARGVRGAPRPDHRRPARAELHRGRRAAHGAADEPAPRRPCGRGHPPRPPAAPAPAAAGRGAGRDPRHAAALHRGRDPQAADRRRDHTARSDRRHAAPADRRLGRRASAGRACPSPVTPTPTGSSPSSPATTGRSPIT